METYLEIFLRLFCHSTALFTLLNFAHVLIKMLFTITTCCLINFYKDSISISGPTGTLLKSCSIPRIRSYPCDHSNPALPDARIAAGLVLMPNSSFRGSLVLRKPDPYGHAKECTLSAGKPRRRLGFDFLTMSEMTLEILKGRKNNSTTTKSFLFLGYRFVGCVLKIGTAKRGNIKIFEGGNPFCKGRQL